MREPDHPPRGRSRTPRRSRRSTTTTCAPSTATFDTEERSLARRRSRGSPSTPDRIRSSSPRTTSSGRGAGGRSAAWGTRCAYRHTVEISVYVAAGRHGQRHRAGALRSTSRRGARELGHHAVISQIVHENEPSLKMARGWASSTSARLREVGRKFDRWLDVVLMELVLDSGVRRRRRERRDERSCRPTC